MRNIMSRMEEKDKAGVPKEDFETAKDIATDSIPGVSETKDIISLGSNIGKGDYVGAGIDATSLALGAVPVVGDIARQGFKSLVAKDIKKATEFLKDTNLIDKWKKDNPNPKPQKRNPDVEKAANELLDGKITGKQYRSVVKENMPIRKINEVPEIPTFTEIVGSLTSDKSKKGVLGLNKKIEDGTRVASRLDIPAYEKHDKWIVSVHDAKNKKGIEGLDGDIIGYGKTAVLKNVEFKSNPQAASKISAKRADKGTIARIFGDYVNADPDKVATSAKKFLKDPEWTQVGYNPFRHGFFYDKDTGLPVKSAKEVLQVGPLVLAKNAKKFTISEAKKLGVKGGLKIRTSGKSQVVFNEGGVTMKKQMELFEDGGLKDEGGMVDEVSGNDVPPGSTREEVRDDIPAQLSEGEFVFPADVVRYIGLEKLMMMRQEAKQGLKQMEAMGQMGNSDEATMPDDLPFDETDLDIEDDLEYNTGGVVQAQRGTYVAPTVPTGSQPLGTTPMGAPPIPQQVGTGVSGTAFGTSYTPNVGKMYGAGATPYAPVTYTELLGPSATGAPQTKNVRYVNEATNQTRMIPHLLNADGTIGDTLYPVPQGFVRQDEAPKEEAKKTQVQTAKVAPVDTGDGGDSGTTTSAVDPAGDPLSYSSIFDMDNLDKQMSKIGAMQLSTLGKAGIAQGVFSSVTGTPERNQMKLGAITPTFTSLKEKLGLKGKNLVNATKEDRDVIAANVERVSAAIDRLTTNITFSKDEKGNTISTESNKSTADVIAEVNAMADKYGLDKIDTKNNVNLGSKIGQKVAEINNAIQDQPTTDMTKGPDVSIVDDPSEPVSDSTDIGGGPAQGPSDMGLGSISTDNDGGQASSSDDGGYSDSGYSDSVDTGGFSTGGLAGKKKVKTKKMKRGGLASKK